MAKHHINRTLTETFNTSTGKCETSIKLDIPTEIVQSGFVTKIGGPKHFAVLITILAHSDAKGESYPTQERIAKLVGMTRQTVSKVIADLLEVKINGNYLIGREKIKTGEFVNSLYTYMVPEELAPVEEREFNSAKDVLDYFLKKYEETFKISYIPSWGKDTGMIRDKLYSQLTDAQIKGVIDIAVGEYTANWYNTRYPRPTVSVLCGWLGNTALQMFNDRNKKEEELLARMDIDTSNEEDIFNKYF